MPPKKANACPVFLPGVGSIPCTIGGQSLFGLNAPAFATHALVVATAAAAYLYNIGDVHYQGFAIQYLNLLDPLVKMLPPDYHWWICNIVFVESLLCLFQTPVNGLFAKVYGLCASSLQIAAAVTLPSIGAFYLKPFEGYAFLLFALGWCTGLFFTVKCRVKKWGSLAGLSAIAKLSAVTASNHGTISNFHHAVFVAAFLCGAVAFASMGPAHGKKAAGRGRSASVSKRK